MKKSWMMFMIAISMLLIATTGYAIPAAPVMTLSTQGQNVAVSWTPVQGATGYTLVYAAYPWQPWMTMNDIQYADMGTSTSFSVGLWNGAAFYVAVQAYDGQGNSDFSNIDYFFLGSLRPSLPDSGQINCYSSAGSLIDCSNTGQDGEYTINPLSYVNNGNGTIKDNITGLVWQQSDDGIKRYWVEASAYCNDLSLGGLSDWRLPSYQELLGIVDYSKRSPSINTNYFRATLDPSGVSLYWTSTVPNYSETGAGAIALLHGGGGNFTKTNMGFVRCVY